MKKKTKSSVKTASASKATRALKVSGQKVSSQKVSYQKADSYVDLDVKELILPVTTFVSSLMITVALIVGSLIVANAINDGGVNSADTDTTTDSDSQGAVTVDIDKIKDIFESDDYVTFGDADRKALFVMFSDPSCPYCHLAAGLNPELNKEVGSQFTLVKDGGTYVAPVEEMRKLVDEGKASFAWIYTNGHGNGELGTQAMYCGDEKGKFWEVHDLLMTNAGYNLLNNEVKNDTAQAGKLADFLASAVDKSFMQDCLEDGKYKERVAKEDQFAGTLGVSGTPGFFINETNYAGAYSWEQMKATAEAALE